MRDIPIQSPRIVSTIRYISRHFVTLTTEASHGLQLETRVYFDDFDALISLRILGREMHAMVRAMHRKTK